MIKQFKIDDHDYEAEVPEGYTDITRLTYKNNRPGVFGTNIHGKLRFFTAKKLYAKKTS